MYSNISSHKCSAANQVGVLYFSLGVPMEIEGRCSSERAAVARRPEGVEAPRCGGFGMAEPLLGQGAVSQGKSTKRAAEQSGIPTS